MINFQHISLNTFLNDYWQKKSLVIRHALPDFINPLSPDELAGLALEEDIESRIVFETPSQKPYWHLKRGPFSTKDFNQLPNTHWTLLVQGVDRLIPEVNALLDHLNFIPQWRIDDIMISYAVLHGSVGPHYDNYDVFLYQAKGRREWLLTTHNCTPENYVKNLELRIMNEFPVEERIILEEGDMLYLPPHVGHYGISRSEECMTYSFGYRSYPGQELLEHFADYLSATGAFKTLYRDPNWSNLQYTSEIPSAAWQNAQHLLQSVLQNEHLIKSWFGCYVTSLDEQAEHHLLEHDDLMDFSNFMQDFNTNKLNLIRNLSCRFGYYAGIKYQFYINGKQWDVDDVSNELLNFVADNRYLPFQSLNLHLNTTQNQLFIYNLYKLQYLHIG